MDLYLQGTKKEIFERSIELFSRYSYENISIRDIANSIKKYQGAIYNHFESKSEILETIYNYYVSRINDMKPSLEKIDLILQNGTLKEIIENANFLYLSEKNKLMQDIFLIINQRKYFDERAKQISSEIIFDRSIEFIERIFERTIEIRRFEPFDVRSVATMCNYLNLCTYMRRITAPPDEDLTTLAEEEEKIYNRIAATIVDLRDNTEK